MSRDPILVSIELRFRTTEEAGPLGDRIREAVALIVGREELQEFRVRTLPLVERKGPRPVE